MGTEAKKPSPAAKGGKGMMARMFKKASIKHGRAPGEMVHVGEHHTERTRITVMDYTADRFDEKELPSAEACFAYRDAASVTWINVDGVHDVALIEKLGTHFGLHPLVMEDIVNTGQRPKTEVYDEYVYMVMTMLRYDDVHHEVRTEQVSLVLGKGFVLSFQEQQGDVFDPVRQRIRHAKGAVRKSGADYLAYVLLDALVDGYFLVLEHLGEQTEWLDAQVAEKPLPHTPRSIQRLRTELILMRKAVWPLRESVATLQRDESELLGASLRPYLADLHDHTARVADTTEMLRDLVSGVRDTYLSYVSNRMNEVMKVLTIIATIFIPITFVAGIYGMNFENMPELKNPNGYYYALGAMAAIVVGMLGYFRKKGWV